MKRRTTLIVLVVLLALVVSGCGKKKVVGANLKSGDGGGPGAIGPSTTTIAPTATTAKPSATTAKPTATTARPTATTQAEQPAYVIRIQSDTAAGGQFNKQQAQCPIGRICRWTNTDSKARSVVADDGAFTSPMIAPGANWDYRPSTGVKGLHNYHDGTRPYAVGQVNFY
ncbi:MAG: hypothetical protein QOG03_363 [Actinomycetota bacterium]|jgi:predicted small secreted protein|nr:hypothetical protein [Actinomycetota bacterium]